MTTGEKMAQLVLVAVESRSATTVATLWQQMLGYQMAVEEALEDPHTTTNPPTVPEASTSAPPPLAPTSVTEEPPPGDGLPPVRLGYLARSYLSNDTWTTNLWYSGIHTSTRIRLERIVGCGYLTSLCHMVNCMHTGEWDSPVSRSLDIRKKWAEMQRALSKLSLFEVK